MRSPRPTHVRAVSLLVGALVLAGCSNPLGSDDPPQLAAADRSGRELTQVETKTALPPEASLPEGWNTAAKNVLRPTRGVARVTPSRCQALGHGLDVGYLEASAKSFATYASRRAALGVGIGSHPEKAPSFEPVEKALRTCSSFTLSNGKGDRTQVTVRPLKLGYIAEDTIAHRFLMRAGNEAQTYDAVRVRVGHNVIQGDLVTIGTARPNTKPLATAVKNALLNLS